MDPIRHALGGFPWSLLEMAAAGQPAEQREQGELPEGSVGIPVQSDIPAGQDPAQSGIPAEQGALADSAVSVDVSEGGEEDLPENA